MGDTERGRNGEGETPEGETRRRGRPGEAETRRREKRRRIFSIFHFPFFISHLSFAGFPMWLLQKAE
jgi:hypothetical protein